MLSVLVLVDRVDADNVLEVDSVLSDVLELNVLVEVEAVLRLLVLVDSVDTLEGVSDDEVDSVEDVESELGDREDCVLVLWVLDVWLLAELVDELDVLELDDRLDTDDADEAVWLRSVVCDVTELTVLVDVDREVVSDALLAELMDIDERLVDVRLTELVWLELVIDVAVLKVCKLIELLLVVVCELELELALLDVESVDCVDADCDDGVKLELVLNVEDDSELEVDSVLVLSSSTDRMQRNPAPLRNRRASSLVWNFRSAGIPSTPLRRSISRSSSS